MSLVLSLHRSGNAALCGSARGAETAQSHGVICILKGGWYSASYRFNEIQMALFKLNALLECFIGSAEKRGKVIFSQ